MTTPVMHIEPIGAYVSPNHGQIFVITPTESSVLRKGQLVQVKNVVWKVAGVELSHFGTMHLHVEKPLESDMKIATANEAKNLINSILSESNVKAEANNKHVVDKTPSKPTEITDETKLKMISSMEELGNKMNDVRDWTLQKLELLKLPEPPSVMVMVISMPTDAMREYLKELEPFLKESLKDLEDDGKVTWANVKAVAGKSK